MAFTKLQCTTCGGNLIKIDDTRYRCDSCRLVYERTEQAEDGKLADDMNRASYERWNGRFSEALNLYDRILEENPDNFEANWGAFLSEHNIGYIKAPDGTQTAIFYGVKDERIYDNYNYTRAMHNCPSAIDAKEFAAVAEVLENTRVKAAKAEENTDVDVLVSCVKSSGEKSTDELAVAERLVAELKGCGLKVFCPALDIKNAHPITAEPKIYGAIKKAKVLIAIAFDEENAKSDEMKSIWRRYPRINEKGKVVLVYGEYPDVFPREIYSRAALRADKTSDEIVPFVVSEIKPKKEEAKKEVAAEEAKQETAEAPAEEKKTEKKPERTFAGGSGSQSAKSFSRPSSSSSQAAASVGQYVAAKFSDYGAIRTNSQALRQVADSIRRYETVQDNVMNDCLTKLAYLIGEWNDGNMAQVIVAMGTAKNKFESKFSQTEAFCRWLEEKADILDK